MAKFTVLYDSCVLYPFTLRTLLIELAMTGLFQAKWSERIHEEWTSKLAEKNPKCTPGSLKKLVTNMNAAVPDCLVDGYQSLIPACDLPDPGDNHVLAAALRCGAQAIITENLNDFPNAYLQKYDIEALDPDTFVSLQFELSAPTVLAAVRNSRLWLNPTPNPLDYADRLRRKGLRKTTALLEDYLGLI